MFASEAFLLVVTYLLWMHWEEAHDSIIYGINMRCMHAILLCLEMAV